MRVSIVGSRSIFSYLGCIGCWRLEKNKGYIQPAGECLVNLPAGTRELESGGQEIR